MKKIILLLFLSLTIILPTNVKALSVDKNNLTIEKNKSENISLYTTTEVEITEIQFSLIYTTYDIPGYFYVESGLNDANSGGVVHKIVFPEPISGNIKLGSIKTSVIANPTDTAGTINIHTVTAKTANGETINLKSQTINVTVGTTQVEEPVTNNEPEETESTNMLEKIESDIVKIQLKENVYEYTINVKNNVEELDLKPIAKDEKTKIEISSQKIAELKDNQIIITVKNGDKTEEYKIKVNIVDDIEEIEIDNSEFESTYKYKGKWITLIVILSVALFAGLLLTKKK